MEKQFIQGTPEWLEMRKKYIMASDAPAILGLSPWKSVYQVWEDKLGLSLPVEDNWAMKRGRDLEPIAREAYVLETGNMVVPMVLFHDEISYMGASLDGVSDDKTVAVEIKCPGEKDHLLALQGIVPEKYMPQLQHQLAVLAINEIHYFSYKDGETALITVPRDEVFIKRLLAENKKFWKCVENLTPPPLSERDYKKRSDLEWAKAVSSWKDSKLDLEAAKTRESIYRESLIGMADRTNSIGSGVRVQRVLRMGSVDYKSVPELKDVDLEKYRKESIESWRITQC